MALRSLEFLAWVLLEVARAGVKFSATARHLITPAWFAKHMLASVALNAADWASAWSLTCLGHLKISCHV